VTEAQATEIVIVGTLHEYHHTSPHYSPEELRRILVALAPAAFCVELDSTFFDEHGEIKPEIGNAEDFPDMEMVFEARQALGVRLLPFDREGRDEFYRSTGYGERQKRLNDWANGWLQERSRVSPDAVAVRIARMVEEAERAQEALNRMAPARLINSEAYDRVIRMKHSLGNILTDLLGQEAGYQDVQEDDRLIFDEWRDRNQAMAENLVRIASGFPGQRLVVTTGSEHRHMLRELLAGRPGIVLREYWEVLGE